MVVLCGLLVAMLVVWSLTISFVPGIEQAIQQLPSSGGLEHGRLFWPRPVPDSLVETPFLALVVTAGAAPAESSTSDVRLEWRDQLLHLCSLFGCLDFAYPREASLPLGKPAVEPWWGAWKPAVLTAIGLTLLLLLLLFWSLLSWIYLWPVRLISFFLDRALTLAGAWRLCLAALMPGALLLASAIMLYATGTFGLVGLLLAAACHFVPGWVYLAGALARLPSIDPRAANPFQPMPPADEPAD